MKRYTVFGSFFALVLGAVTGAQAQMIPANSNAQFGGSRRAGLGCWRRVSLLDDGHKSV